MQSVKILSHSIKMVLNNLSVALRLSVPLIGAMVLSVILFGQEVFVGSSDIGDPFNDPVMALNSGFSTILQLVATLWVAVAWHRYILLEETPRSTLPAFNGGRILAYFGWGLLIVVIIGAVVAVVGGIGSLLVAGGGIIGGLLGIVMIVASIVFAIYFSARVYVILPSVAVGQTLSFGQAWEATRGYAGPIIFAYFLFMVAALVTGIVFSLVSVTIGLAGVVLMIALNLILTLIGMSFLTTVYGITVEKREI